MIIENGKFRDRFIERCKKELKEQAPEMTEEDLEFYANWKFNNYIEEREYESFDKRDKLCPLNPCSLADHIDIYNYKKNLYKATSKIDFIKNHIDQIEHKLIAVKEFKKNNPKCCEECKYIWCKEKDYQKDIKTSLKIAKRDLHEKYGIETQDNEDNSENAKDKILRKWIDYRNKYKANAKGQTNIKKIYKKFEDKHKIEKCSYRTLAEYAKKFYGKTLGKIDNPLIKIK